ncbi:DUF7159 family protein [Mycobacterium szulgai]|uniref:DUF7159 family protein n=1 Tax=Mycobacterium szulgai TaxID=1787 RepID=UPI0021F30C7C
MDVVLGVSMAPSAVRVVVVEGEDGDGAIVEEESFQVGRGQAASPSDQVISAILGTREGAADAGLRLSSIGVTWTDHMQAAVLRDALAARKIENVMLVSAFLAAAALGQAVGGAVGYERTAVLYIEPDAATLAVVDTADGSVSDLHRKLLAEDDDAAVAELVEMVSAAESLATHPEGLYVVGSGVDVPLIKPALDAATSLTVSVPEEPDMALARGAALASGNAPLFASSTAALAYAQDACLTGRDGFAYDELSDDDDDGADAVARRPVLLVGSAAAVVAIVAVIALEIALAIGIRPTVALQPTPSQNHFIAPTQQTPTQVAAPQPKIDLPRPTAVPRALPPQRQRPYRLLRFCRQLRRLNRRLSFRRCYRSWCPRSRSPARKRCYARRWHRHPCGCRSRNPSCPRFVRKCRSAAGAGPAEPARTGAVAQSRSWPLRRPRSLRWRRPLRRPRSLRWWRPLRRWRPWRFRWWARPLWWWRPWRFRWRRPRWLWWRRPRRFRRPPLTSYFPRRPGNFPGKSKVASTGWGPEVSLSSISASAQRRLLGELWTPYLVCRWRQPQSGWCWSRAKTATERPSTRTNFRSMRAKTRRRPAKPSR